MNVWPYTNFHELNLDWILSKIKEMQETLDVFVNVNTIKYANPLKWDITRQYEANTVVVDEQGTAYLSVTAVPAGISITRDDYWTVIGNFSQLWVSFKAGITPSDEGASTTATRTYSVDDLVWVSDDLYIVTKAMTAGDKFTSANSAVTSVNAELRKLRSSIADFADNLNAEITAREKADTELRQSITANANAIAAETTARTKADTDLQAALTGSIHYVTPEDYGARGDGTTDDTAAVQAAFNAAGVDTPILLLGAYYCTATITVKRDTTVRGNVDRPRAVLSPYLIFAQGVTPAFSIVGTQDETVDYGGTCENVVFDGMTVALQGKASEAHVAFNVQWARFVIFRHCSVYGFTTAVNFANVNGLTVDDFEYSSNGTANITVFNKFNDGGATGIVINHIVVNNFSDVSSAVVVSDTTANGQAGDRQYTDFLCVSNWDNVIYYTHGTGFSRHVFIDRIYADRIRGNLVYLVGSGTSEDANISNLGCHGVAGAFRALLSQGYCRVTATNITGSAAVKTYSFVDILNATDVALTNIILDGQATYFISVSGGARVAVCNARNTAAGDVNVSNDASYCQWCNISTVGKNNLLLSGTTNQGTNIHPASTN